MAQRSDGQKLERYTIDDIYSQWHVVHMLIDWTEEFDRWWRNIEQRQSLDSGIRQIAAIVGTQLGLLQILDQEPEEQTRQFRRVAQSKSFPLWRISHPRREEIALRLIVWFPPFNRDLVLVVMGVNKAKMGDIFCDGVGNRADNLIREFLQDEENR
jgi:hypothetical protein